MRDNLYGSEVDTDSPGLFPTPEIVRPYMDSPAADRAPFTDNSDVRPQADDDELDPDLIDEYAQTPPLHPVWQINDRPAPIPK